MSFQQPQQQPVVIYPNTVTKQPDSTHSNGSFGAVFIVLAVIVVLSAIACFLGRLCTRRYHRPKPKQNQSKKKQRASLPKLEREPRQNHSFRGREFEDIEFGFDKGVNPVASAKAKGSRDSRPPNKRGDQVHGEPRFAYGEEGDLKTAAQFGAA